MGKILFYLRHCENANSAEGALQQGSEHRASSVLGKLEPTWEPFAAEQRSFMPWWSGAVGARRSHPKGSPTLRGLLTLCNRESFGSWLPSHPLALCDVVAVGRLLQLLCLK